MSFQIAQAAIDIETARLLTYNAARRKEEGRSFTKEAAMAKYWASVVAQRVSGQAIEWAGGVGFTRETGIEKFWRDSKIVSLMIFSLVLLMNTCVGCNIRRNFQYPTTDDRQVHSERILIATQGFVS
jgi:alkylation response protein AidB-like acyl-CoA dehydrogenase